MTGPDCPLRPRPTPKSIIGDNGHVSSDEETRAALTERYGVIDPDSRRRRRIVVMVVAGIAVVAFLVLAVVSTNKPVRTEEASFRVIDDTAVEVTFIAHRSPGTTTECTVWALNATFAQIGVAHVTVPAADERSTAVTARVATTEPATGARVASCQVVDAEG